MEPVTFEQGKVDSTFARQLDYPQMLGKLSLVACGIIGGQQLHRRWAKSDPASQHSEEQHQKSLGDLITSYTVLCCCTPSLFKLYNSSLGNWITNSWMWDAFLYRVIKRTFFWHFCAGENPAEVQETGNRLRSHGIYSIVDYAAEGDAGNSFEQFAKTNFENLKQSVQIASLIGGSVAVKLTALIDSKTLRNEEIDEQLLMEHSGVECFDALAGRAQRLGVDVYVDAEQSYLQKNIDRVAIHFMKKYPGVVFNTYQLYRKDTLDRLAQDYRNVTSAAPKQKLPFCVKLVRGAYMKEENEIAATPEQSPIHRTRDDTDRSYNAGVEYMLRRAKEDGVSRVLVASHNEKSIEKAAALAKELSVKDQTHFGQLLGMKDFVTDRLASSGYRVYKYLPYGPIREVVPYLGRRALENSSILGGGDADRRYLWSCIKERLFGSPNKT